MLRTIPLEFLQYPPKECPPLIMEKRTIQCCVRTAHRMACVQMSGTGHVVCELRSRKNFFLAARESDR
eukprot:1081285-Rhodomonas_salina.1